LEGRCSSTELRARAADNVQFTIGLRANSASPDVIRRLAPRQVAPASSPPRDDDFAAAADLRVPALDADADRVRLAVALVVDGLDADQIVC